MTVPTALPRANNNIMESVLIKGDLSALTPDERAMYYNEVCKSLGLNPFTKPFEFIVMNGRLQLYALRSCADQLRKIHSVSLEIVSRDVVDDMLTVHVRAKMPDGRVDEDLGSVAFPLTLRGEARANAELKCVTKAKRRATLSICGLGWLDGETEVADIPTSSRQTEKDAVIVTAKEVAELEQLLQERAGPDPANVQLRRTVMLKFYQVDDISKMTMVQHAHAVRHMSSGKAS